MATFANTSSPTPFSAFDSDSAFQTEADAMFVFVKRKLGDDILSVELTKKQVWACFEESVFEFGKFINEYMTKSQLGNMLGGATGSLSGSEGRFPRETLEFLIRKAEPYATQAAVGGSHDVMSGSIIMSSSKQDYDVYKELVNDSGELIFDTQTHKTKMRIFEVFHFNPQAAYRFFDTTSAINYLNNEFSFESFTPETVFYVLPVFEDVLRAGQMDISNRVRRSNFSYQLIGTNLRLFPRPTDASAGKKVWLRVGFVNDGLTTPFEDASMDGISAPHNLPYGNIDFSNINSMGRQWIRQYTLGGCKEVLGLVRSKFGSIPIPNGDLSLNGDSLISAGKEEKDRLRTELREMFDSLTYDKLIETQSTEATNIQTILKTIPIPLGKCITVG
jgi:hypothetical protein